MNYIFYDYLLPQISMESLENDDRAIIRFDKGDLSHIEYLKQLLEQWIECKKYQHRFNFNIVFRCYNVTIGVRDDIVCAYIDDVETLDAEHIFENRPYDADFILNSADSLRFNEVQNCFELINPAGIYAYQCNYPYVFITNILSRYLHDITYATISVPQNHPHRKIVALIVVVFVDVHCYIQLHKDNICILFQCMLHRKEVIKPYTDTINIMKEQFIILMHKYKEYMELEETAPNPELKTDLEEFATTPEFKYFIKEIATFEEFEHIRGGDGWFPPQHIKIGKIGIKRVLYRIYSVYFSVGIL